MGDDTYSVQASRWIEYWETRLQLAGGSVYTDGRVKITYTSSRSDGESTMFAEVEQVTRAFGDKIQVYLDVDSRTPRYWLEGYTSGSKFDICYDPDNTRGDKTLGALRDIEWVVTPAERAEEREAAVEGCTEVKVCKRCGEENPPDATRCALCDGYISGLEPVKVEEVADA